MFQIIDARQFMGSLLEAMAMANLVSTAPRSIGPGRKTSGLRRTGRKYQHSSKRQQARYARQLEAGQIKFIVA